MAEKTLARKTSDGNPKRRKTGEEPSLFEQELLETAEEVGDSTVHLRPPLAPINTATDEITFQQFDILDMPGSACWFLCEVQWWGFAFKRLGMPSGRAWFDRFSQRTW